MEDIIQGPAELDELFFSGIILRQAGGHFNCDLMDETLTQVIKIIDKLSTNSSRDDRVHVIAIAIPAVVIESFFLDPA